MKTHTFAILVLFCVVLRAMAAPDDKTAFNVRGYGAVGDGTNLDSPAINQAILAAAAAGGGTVLVPAGTYLCGSIRLTNNIHLFWTPARSCSARRRR